MVDRDWGSQPSSHVVSLAEVARVKSGRVPFCDAPYGLLGLLCFLGG